jgi:tetratricopeptide (TPR) repeat protein
MTRLVVVVGIAAGLMLSAKPASAQWRDADCDLGGAGHFLVNSGKVYLEGASEERDETKQLRLLGDAQRNFVEAIERGEVDNPAVWYYLGRYYVLAGDPLGADSAFDRAEQLEPDCAEDMSLHRRIMWVPLINEALDSMQADAWDGAKPLLYGANAIFDEDIIAFYYLARIYGSEGEMDSALVYFRKVTEMGTEDETRQENYLISVYNMGLIYGMAGEPDSAAAWYERYRAINPSDFEAMTGLAQAYTQLGDTERAAALYDSVLSRAEGMAAMELFRTGESLFMAENYALAARAFELGLEKNRFFRPALYNLTNAYLAICQDDSTSEEGVLEAASAMESAARRLADVDPYNYDAHSLLAAAYQLQHMDDSTLAVLERLETHTWSVEVELQQAVPGGFAVQGSLTNLWDEAAAQTEVLTFEFVDGEGNVLATETVEAQSLAIGEEYPFELMVGGEGIEAVRYRVGG